MTAALLTLGSAQAQPGQTTSAPAAGSEEAREISQIEEAVRSLGRDHPHTLGRMRWLAEFYHRRGRYGEAEPLYRHVADTLQRDFPGRFDTLSAATALATLYHDQGRFAEAEPLFRRVLGVHERGEDASLLTGSLHDLAVLYHDQGRFAEAEPLYQRIIVLNEQDLGRNSRDTLEAVASLAALYLDQGRTDAAIALAGRAGDPGAARERENVQRNFGQDRPETLSYLATLARLHLIQGAYEDAERLYRHILESRERVRGPEDGLTLAAVHNLAVLYHHQERHAEAEPLYRRAFEARERVLGFDIPDTIETANGLAEVYRHQGRLDEAETLYRRILESRERLLGRDHPATMRAASRLASLQLRRGARAAEALRSARLLVEGLRLRGRKAPGLSQGARAQIDREMSSAATGFALFGDAAWAASQDPAQRNMLLPEAFSALQDSMAGGADRAIAEQAARRYFGNNPALGETMRERGRLEDQWGRLSENLAAAFSGGDEGTPAFRAAMRIQMDAVQARIAAIDARLRVQAPDYFSLVSPSPLDVPAAQHLLSGDEAILLVVPSQFGTHIVAVTRNAIQWHRSDWGAARVRDAVQVLRRDIALEPRLGPRGERAFDRTVAHQLYEQLVAPVAPLLAGRRQVYIAAGGSLAALPFSMLVAAPPIGQDDDPAALRETQWLGDQFALVHVPSIQSLALLSGAPTRPGNRGRFIGIGNPVLRGDPAPPIDISAPRGTDIFFEPARSRGASAIANVATLHQLSPLPGTARELEAVRATLGAPVSSLLMARRATEPNVRAANLSSASILLFSTHGLTVTEGFYVGVGESGLVLTPPATASDADDGFLAASEVTTLRLDADWVILSACNTATGDGVNSAGLGGLSRAFFYAGARNLLASHWLVSDEVAPVLITRTLALERAGVARAEAFRRAMREVRMDTAHDDWAHPFFWAPFVLIGDGGGVRDAVQATDR